MSLSEQYYVYILTDFTKKLLYTGVTNNLKQRIIEHYLERGRPGTFAGKHSAYYLLYYETSSYITNAIKREKQIKGWSRAKKIELIRSVNPLFEFLNKKLFGEWPPKNIRKRNN